MEELPIPKLPQQATKIKKQELDDVSKRYTHKYENCMLCCTHKSKHNRNIYIPDIIHAGLCYTMPLIIPSGLKVLDPSANIFNSKDKACEDNSDFFKDCDAKVMQLIYNYQQNKHVRSMDWKQCQHSITTYLFTNGFQIILRFMFKKRKHMRCYGIND